MQMDATTLSEIEEPLRRGGGSLRRKADRGHARLLRFSQDPGQRAGNGRSRSGESGLGVRYDLRSSEQDCLDA
ncbi:MAG: hypothetical protein PWQ29_1080 [Verrucomicrobiota bacterium]|nr:hypothetical protein [Verrucomicrobiota bacterium]MDK2963686.1 hypothetical protein [Verrucomicrobiota bacterium]